MNEAVIIWPEQRGNPWRLFRNPKRIIVATATDDVLPAIEEVELATDSGLHSVGFISYEAASAFDPACRTHPLEGLPLLWFGLFESPETIQMDNPGKDSFNIDNWTPSMSAKIYSAAIARIKEYLKAGDTYQVNYTLRLRSPFTGDPQQLFAQLCRTQRAQHCAFINTDDFAICSASPELFFRLDGDDLVSRPMKGTSRRGLTSEQDKALATSLHTSEKNRAENVMIVDMIRNDMGRVAQSGSVHVPTLFEIERYPTVLQMTSTVASRTDASLSQIFSALFPCASITGAPKVRTMEIIRELEPEPRGVYTGAIGIVSPNRRAEFNVAIRTVVLDKTRGTAEYGVGGGIVWDSDAANEYEECHVKAAVLTSDVPAFELLETMLWRGGDYLLLDDHLSRLARSAEYFGISIDLNHVRARLMEIATSYAAGTDTKVRLQIADDGGIAIDHEPLRPPVADGAWIIGLAPSPIDPASPFLYHKTTNRTVYETARASIPDCNEVILWNQHRQVTEGTITNVVVEKDGRRLTPPVSCGLLPGVFRGHLLTSGEIEEGIVLIDDLLAAERVWLINSVREWIPAKLLLRTPC